MTFYSFIGKLLAILYKHARAVYSVWQKDLAFRRDRGW
jgi:hypothetical protein